MFVRRISVVVRLFNLRDPSNVFVLSGFAAALVIGSAIEVANDKTLGSAIATGMQAGFTVLLSWALARELDPDRPFSATIAAIAGILIFFTGEVRLAVVMTLMFAVRIVNRSAGASPTIIDLAWLLGLCAFCAKSVGGWIGGVALGIALVWDTRLERPAPARSMVVGVVGIVAAIAVTVVEGNALPGWSGPSVSHWVVIALAVAGILAMASVRTEPVAAVEDYTDNRLSRDRLNRGRAMAVAAAALSVALLGGAAVPALVGLWAAFIGVGVRVAGDLAGMGKREAVT